MITRPARRAGAAQCIDRSFDTIGQMESLRGQMPGSPYPLGATLTAAGVNFAVIADGRLTGTAADSDDPPAVQLCLIDDIGAERRIPLLDRTSGVWHAFVPGVGAGQRYGYRVAATDPAKLLLDPYARRVDRTAYDLAAARTPGADTAGRAPVGIVTAAVTSVSARPAVPWEHTVIYEAHVKGLTQQHPAVPAALRGTYAGVMHPAVIEHLTRLGVTALELLPVHAHAAEPMLAAAGRPNYWGYSTLSFFAVHPGYAARPGAEVTEFVAMVDALHEAGIEVLLDVVFNHTCEGGQGSPIPLSWRGLAPGTYYLPTGRDLSGTGNTLNTGTLPVVRMVTDSLRYFATDLGVDGFRFDLAPVLGRPGGGAFDPGSALLTAIAADPVLQQRKLIAEPWDATGAGYSLGRFGPDWAEWNDRFRDTVRDFWRGTPGVRDLAYRLSGSEDVFGGRQPWASINFVTAHDGFTLRDVVSYARKHNEPNGQDGHDGTDDNRSANYGVEGDPAGDTAHDGPSGTPVDSAIAALRARQARNLAATLLLSTGTPMVCAGDEMWRTQAGNNNAYCIDSPLTWLDWAALDDPAGPAADMMDFIRTVLRIRATAPALHQGTFFSGQSPRDGDGLADLTWFTPAGTAMTTTDWFDAARQTLAVWFDGNDIRGHGPHGERLTDDSWLLVLHAGAEDIAVTLPGVPYGDEYTPVLDTAQPTGRPADVKPVPCGRPVSMPGRTLWLLKARRSPVLEPRR